MDQDIIYYLIEQNRNLMEEIDKIIKEYEGSNSQTKFVSSSYESTILDKRDVMIQLVIDVDTNLIVAKLRT
ncbi:MAG: hypothetical protein QW046_04830, partial [Candidatus Micrarchaeaceae archaeon]